MLNQNRYLSIFDSYFYDQPSAELVKTRNWMATGGARYTNNVATIEAILAYRMGRSF